MAERQHTVNPRSKSAVRKEVSFPREDILSVGKTFVEASSFEEISDLLGGRGVLGSMIESELDAHELLHRGLPRAALSSLVDKLHFIHVRRGLRSAGDEPSDPSAPQVRARRASRRAAKRTHLEVCRDSGQGDPRARLARRGRAVAETPGNRARSAAPTSTF